MITEFASRLRRRHLGVVLAALVLLTSAGCQTFNMSEEDFERQQAGEVVDPDAAGAVAFFGTLAACGIVIAELVAELNRK